MCGMDIQGSWVVRGYFDLKARDRRQTTTQEIRDALSRALGRRLEIAAYPVGPQWRHTFWWREGSVDYAEAQFMIRIDEDCPVLSLGVSIEKGLEGADADMRPPFERMDRATWDWQRLIDRRADVLQTDVPEVASAVPRAVNLRVRAYQGAQLPLRESQTFSFADGQWFRRHTGPVEASDVAGHIAALDGRSDLWIDLYLAIDLDPGAADGMTPSDVAALLLHFEPVKRRLRASAV